MAERGNDISDEGLDMLSRLFEEEVPEEELLNQLIPRVPSSVDEELQRRVADILTRNEELEFRLSVLENDNKNLQEKNSLLRSNLTAVYRKSLAEIKFRDSQIAFLKKQLQSIKVAQLTAGDDSRLSQTPFKLSNVSKNTDANIPLAEPCLSMYSADHTTNEHGLSDVRIKEKVYLSSPDLKSTDASSIPASITLSLDSKRTVLNSKEISQSEVTKDSLVVCDDVNLSQVISVDSGQRIEDSSKCNFASAVEGQESVVAHGIFTIEDTLQTAIVKHFAQMPTASLLLSTEHDCLKSVNLLEASSVNELNSVNSLVEDANTLERNLLLTNSDSNDKAGNNQNVTFSQQTTTVGLKCSDNGHALKSKCKAADSIAQESCLFTERAKEKASDESCTLSSGSVNSDLVLFNDKAVSVADEKTGQREIQKKTSRKNKTADVSSVHKSNETLLQTSTEKRRNLDLNLEKSRDQSNELKTSSVVDLRMKIQSKTSHHSSKNSLHSECSSVESSKDKRKGFKDKTGDAHLGRDDNSRRGRNDESRRRRSSSISEVGDRISEQKTSKPHRSSEKDLRSHKRKSSTGEKDDKEHKSSTGEKDDKEPHMKKGKYEGTTIQEKLLRLSVLETATSHCCKDLPAASADCKQLDEHQRRSSQSALAVPPERSVLEADKHHYPNTPEIEQMQRYIQLAHHHNTAQKIIQKEAAKHVNKIIEEKKLAAAKRREADEMFDSSTASGQDDDKINKKNKRLDSDVVKPSPTLFSRRAEAKLKQACPATTAKAEQSLGKQNDINPENRELMSDRTAVNFQLECLKNVSVESLELSKILQTVSTKSVLESSCGKEISKESSRAVVSSEPSFPCASGADQSVAEAGTVSTDHLAEHSSFSELVHSIPLAGSNQPLDQQNLTASEQPSCETSKMNSESVSLCCSTPLHPGAEIQTPCQQQQQEANQNDSLSKIFDSLCRNSPGSPDMLFDVAVAGKTPRAEHEYSTDKVSKLINESFDRDFYADLESVQLEDLGIDGISTEYLVSGHVMEGTFNDIEHFFDPFTEHDKANFADKSCVLNSDKRLKSMTNDVARSDQLILSAESDHTQIMVTNEAVNGGEVCGLVSSVSQRESKLGNGGCKVQEEPNLLLDHKSTLKPTVGSLEAENDALSTGCNDALCHATFNEPELLQVHAPEESFDFLQSGIADQLFGNLSFSSSSSSESEKLCTDEDREFKAVDTKEISRGCIGDDELEEGELDDSLQNTLRPSQESHNSNLRNEKSSSSKWKKRRSWSQGNLVNGKRKVEQQNDSWHHQTAASEKIKRSTRSRSPEPPTSSLKSKTRHSDDELRRHYRDNKHQTHSRVRQQYRGSSDRKRHANRSLDRDNRKKF